MVIGHISKRKGIHNYKWQITKHGPLPIGDTSGRYLHSWTALQVPSEFDGHKARVVAWSLSWECRDLGCLTKGRRAGLGGQKGASLGNRHSFPRSPNAVVASSEIQAGL